MAIQQLRVGMIGESIIKVTDAESARVMGSGALDVFATPAMIALMEAAAVAAIDPFLDSRQASVGIEINVKHMAA
ncbi:MAG: dihydrolipoamide acyltransferase, partial [Anaerolineae bacterium]|nr:dihydrolipoamide acyltransferase [Anaerolineae bacterium]